MANRQPVRADGLAAKAVHELGISPSAVERFTSSFVAGAVTAGLAEADNGQLVLLDPADRTESADDLLPGPDEPRVEPVLGRARIVAAPPVVHQEWTLPGGSVVFEVRLDRPLPASVFAQLGAVVQEVEALADRLRDVVADGR